MRKMLSASCGPALRLVIWLSAVLSASSAAFAADQPPTVPLAALFIAQIVLLLLVGRLLGEAMQRIGQPAVKGQLIAGVILGSSVFGALWVLVTHLIGIHSVLGAFVAGILVGESPILTQHINEQLRGLVIALFMPVFLCDRRAQCRPLGAQGP